MTPAIRKFLALQRLERRLLIEALVALPLVALVLATLGARRCYQALSRVAPMVDASNSSGTAASQQASRIARMVRMASRRVPFPATCLVRSMTTWWLLRHQRLPAELRIGVRKQQGRFEAHAWVEHAGVALDEDAPLAEGYLPFARDRSVFERRRLETP